MFGRVEAGLTPVNAHLQGVWQHHLVGVKAQHGVGHIGAPGAAGNQRRPRERPARPVARADVAQMGQRTLDQIPVARVAFDIDVTEGVNGHQVGEVAVAALQRHPSVNLNAVLIHGKRR